MLGKNLQEENAVWSPVPSTQKQRNCLGHVREQLSLHLAVQTGSGFIASLGNSGLTLKNRSVVTHGDRHSLAVGFIKEDPDSILTNYLSKEENKTKTSLCV